MIYMEERHKVMVSDILKKYPYHFYAYGSRVKGTHRATSDLDICFMESIPLRVQSQIQEDFEESRLPFRVDLSDFNQMQESFQNRIKNDLVQLQ